MTHSPPQMTSSMNALKYHGAWRIALEPARPPRCESDDDVVVKISACGICGTDIGIITGDYRVAVPGTTLGHEASGVVQEVGARVADVQPGDRVVIEPTYSCGRCRLCQTGRPNHCCLKAGTEAGVSCDGAFADLYRTTSRFVHRIPEHASFEASAMTEPLCCAWSGVKKIPVRSIAMRTCILGAGPMGLLYYWSMLTRGLAPFVVETNPARLAFASSILGPDRVSPSVADALAARHAPGDQQLDIVVDTSGRMLESMYPWLAPGGTFLSVGLKSQPATIDTIALADKSLTVFGSIDALQGDFIEAFHLICAGVVPVQSLITHRLPLREHKEAFRMLGCNLDARRLEPIGEPAGKIVLVP